MYVGLTENESDTFFEEKTEKTCCLIIIISSLRGRSRVWLDVGVDQVNGLGHPGED